MYFVALIFLVVLHLYINFEKRHARKFDTDLFNENNDLDRNNSRRSEKIRTISDIQTVPPPPWKHKRSGEGHSIQ